MYFFAWGLNLRILICRKLSLNVSSNVDPKIMIASRYIGHRSHCNPENMASMRRSIVTGLLKSPKCKTLNWKTLCGLSFLFLSASSMTACQYPLARSKVQFLAPDRVLRDSSIRGNGYAFFLVTEFNLRYSTLNRVAPSRFEREL